MAFDQSQPAYVSFRDQIAERTKRLVAWVGAGASASAGMPTWIGLQDLLVQGASATARTMDKVSRVNMEKAISTAVKQNNPWITFKLLREAYGIASYRDEIRRAFSNAPRVAIPEIYKAIWKLGAKGVLNLNIDRIATRALSDVGLGTNAIEFNGDRCANMTHVLSNQRPFIANLHGDVEDVASWIFTHDELSALLRNPGYMNFVRSCISTHTILFLGITAEDRAVGGHLEWFAKNGIDTGPHFWVTDRVDRDTNLWAEKASIRIIRYSNSDGHHAEFNEFLTNILTYVPPEDIGPFKPVVSRLVPAGPDTPISSPSELEREGTDSIRQALNSRANEILKNSDDASYQKFEKFCEEYDEAIHRAWYVSTIPGKNTLLDYQLIEQVQRGAFGQVYRAIDKNGEPVAIKLLLEEIRNNGDLLRSFRRGVRSMRILQDHHSLGMVKYIDASEIPAFVAMEWIDGPNLNEAVHSNQVNDWRMILRIARDLARIITQAHALPERVLHRDLRPANIMLKDYYTDPDNWSVVVLDFDLSWHRGAIERSVMHSTALGYLAPEQMRPRQGMSTRHAAVDSFGLGMTVFFICTGQDPVPEQHKHQDWAKTLSMRVASRRCIEWKSAPRRVARLIEFSTLDEQSRRWDVGQIQAELSRLFDAISNPAEVVSAELVAEELAAHSEMMQGYEWNQNRSQAAVSLPSGITIALAGDEPNRAVDLELTWGRIGHEERGNLSKSISAAIDRVTEKLRSGGWSIAHANSRMSGLSIEASLDIRDARKNFTKCGAGIDLVCDLVKIGSQR